MNLPASDCRWQGTQGRTVLHSYTLCKFRNARTWPVPDDVVDVAIIPEKGTLAAFEVNHRSQIRLVQTEKVKPGTVLAEFVTIISVLGRGISVSYEHRHSTLSGEPS